MATYAAYVNAIAGKTFPANYFYTVGTATEQYQNGEVTAGQASNFGTTSLSGTIVAVDANAGTFSIDGTVYQIHGSAAGLRNVLVFGPAGSAPGGTFPPPTFILSNTGEVPPNFSYSSNRPYDAPNPACFVAGTRILTTSGEVAIERLAIGDLVATDAGPMPVRWIGRRRLACAGHPWPERVLPIEIAAGAFGGGVPRRPLRVSPGHAIAVDGALVQAERLVNGATIAQVAVATVDYWHIELDRHAIVTAEGLPAESYLDVGNRAEFANGGTVVRLFPAMAAATPEGYCRPLLVDGPVLDGLRDRLLGIAIALGWRVEEMPLDLHLLADGRRIDPAATPGAASFAVPAGARLLQLASRSFVPQHLAAGERDRRKLGVMLSAIEAVDAAGRSVALDLAAPIAGCHAVEGPAERPARWTDGLATLPGTPWDGAVPFTLRLSFAHHARHGWVRAPAPAQAACG